MSETIHPDTTLGAVHLRVPDLGRSIAFYEERLGFTLRLRRGGIARLGAGGADLLVLEESPAARRVRGTTGLYHFAVRVPSRPELARSLARLASTHTPLTGASDHLVSEALYLSDPDGNGIEIYRDRPRAEWPRGPDEPLMATLALDLTDVLSELGGHAPGGGGLAAGTDIGHIHLHVADLERAERFYVGVLGFERMMRFGPSASFVSAGGYHHHVGLNTWAGVGAPAPPPGASGLIHFVVRLPDREALERVAGRLEKARVATEAREPQGFFVSDPSGNRMLLAAAEE